jgi:DNA ligase (NAD+)
MNRKILLENQIKRYNYEYYVLGESSISDVQFDKLYDELKEEFPESEVLNSVGNDMKNGFPKAEHLMVMGSQEKIKSEKQLSDWVERKNIQFPVILEWKYDGISIELQYENGAFVSAVTRGDSRIGDEISHNVKKMHGVPMTLEDLCFTGSVRGEIVLSRHVFKEKYADDFANPRNLASGMAKSKEGKGCEDLTVISYDVNSLSRTFDTEEEKFFFLKDNGFYLFNYIEASSVQEILKIADFYRGQRESFNFSIDGVVIKQNKIDHEDMKNIRPDTQRAFKWEDEGEDTVLRHVEWSRSGITYTPIAIFDPIEIEGSTVSRASLANESLIKDLNLAIGDTILVTKRNMIIPKIEKVISRPFNRVQIDPPTICSCCGDYLVRDNKKLYCPNESCPGRSEHRIGKWLSLMGIKGFGSALQEHLFDNGFHDIKDLYDEELIKKAYDATNLKVNFEKAFNQLHSIKKISLSKFMAGFDIDGIGERIFENIINSGYDSLSKILSIADTNEEDLLKIEGIGIERIKAFFSYHQY